MGIIDMIEKIQAKPEHTRRQIMYVTLGTCMAVVFAIWAANFRNTLGRNVNKSVGIAVATTSPLDYLKGAWTEIMNSKQN